MLRQSSLYVGVHSHTTRCLDVKARVYSWRAPRGERTGRLPAQLGMLATDTWPAKCGGALSDRNPSPKQTQQRGAADTAPIKIAAAATACLTQSRKITRHEKEAEFLARFPSHCWSRIGMMPAAETTGPDTATSKEVLLLWNRRTII